VTFFWNEDADSFGKLSYHTAQAKSCQRVATGGQHQNINLLTFLERTKMVEENRNEVFREDPSGVWSI